MRPLRLIYTRRRISPSREITTPPSSQATAASTRLTFTVFSEILTPTRMIRKTTSSSLPTHTSRRRLMPEQRCFTVSAHPSSTAISTAHTRRRTTKNGRASASISSVTTTRDGLTASSTESSTGRSGTSLIAGTETARTPAGRARTPSLQSSSTYRYDTSRRNSQVSR